MVSSLRMNLGFQEVGFTVYGVFAGVTGVLKRLWVIWVTVKQLNLSYNIGETHTILYRHIYIYLPVVVT